MGIHYRVADQMLHIVGHTYPHRELIKRLGARFHRGLQLWVVEDSSNMRAQVDQLCRSLGGGGLSDANNVFPVDHVLPPSREELSEGASLTREQSPQGFTVKQVLQLADEVLSRGFPKPIWIVGEIQNLRSTAKGFFFSLAETNSDSEKESATSSFRATLWQNEQARWSSESRNLVLRDGLKVRMLVQIKLYRERGVLSGQVLEMDSTYTQGQLALLRQKILRKLIEEGLATSNKNLVLPAFIFRVGLVSGLGSRAASDFVDQLREYRFPGDVLFCPAVMQGENCETSVCRAIETLQNSQVDVIVLTRGGGSADDLRWFDSYAIGATIGRASIPVIAAIGHHEDSCVAEDVCFLRQKTPTAAADWLLFLTQEKIKSLDFICTEVSQLATFYMKRSVARLEFLQLRTALESTKRLGDIAGRLERLSWELVNETRKHLATDRLRLDRNFQEIQFLIKQFSLFNHNRLDALAAELRAMDPQKWLVQGWTQLRFFNGGAIVKNTQGLKKEDLLRARLIDGSLQLRVDSNSSDVSQ